MTPSEVDHQADRGGFALPAVLVVTAVVTLIFLVAMTALDSLNREARSARQRVDATVRAMTAEARYTYLATTEPLGSQGIRIGAPRLVDEFAAQTTATTGDPPPLRLDGRAYRVADLGVQIRAQDLSGLINLSRLGEAEFGRLLEMAGVPPAETGRLWPIFLDYVDADDLRRPGGAEAADYPAGLAPANRPLRRPDELLSVPGVREAIDANAWRELRPFLLADHTQPTFNINTAPPAFFRVMFDMTPAEIERTLAFREDQPFWGLIQLRQISGASVELNDELIYTFPSGRFEIRVEDGSSRWSYRSRLVLTPSHPERPFWIDDRDMAPARGRGPRENDAPELPDTAN